MTAVLVVTAVAAEAEALARDLSGLAAGRPPARPPDDRLPGGTAPTGGATGSGLDVRAVGVGPAAAAAGTARLLALAEAAGRPYRGVVSAGIGGGWADLAPVGAVVLGSACVAADLGADSPDGYLPLDALGFGSATTPVDPDLLAALRDALPGAVAGPVLTVSTVTGTRAGADELRRRYPGAAAEAMEGYGAGVAAAAAGVPFVEVRTISNPVGPRDRSAWRLDLALRALATVGAALAGTVKAWP